MKKLTRAQLVKRNDEMHSLVVRHSAKQKGGKVQCISCGRWVPFAKIDAGHFIQRGCFPLRWDDDNVHPECRGCNRFAKDHLIGYSISLGETLAKRLHEVKMEWQAGKGHVFTMQELREIHDSLLAKVWMLEEDNSVTLIPKSWGKLVEPDFIET